jgi:hypothetical protein
LTVTWATPNAIELVILVLAAYRLFRFASVDGITATLREWVTGYRDPREEDPARKTRRRPEWLADLVACPWCAGWWVSLALTLAWWAWPTAAICFALPWAVSGAAALVMARLDPA